MISSDRPRKPELRHGRVVPASVRRRLHGLVRRMGYQVGRVGPADLVAERYRRPSFDDSRELPDGAVDDLHPDNPRLLELRERYAAVQVPMAVHSLWTDEYLERELKLQWFRGDNPYVYQFRNLRSDARQRYYLYLRDLATRDPSNLLQKLEEDGHFGCWTFEYPSWPRVSRDLLDSISELYFLDRHTQLFSHADWTVLDIGAGYGRLAHRATSAVPGIRWVCTDAVPESTFLCEYYLRYRGAEGAEVVPLDELDASLSGRTIDLAVNVHSFSEMSERAVVGWLDLLVAHGVGRLFVVPNGGAELVTREDDGRQLPIAPLLAERGYQATVSEPSFLDPSMPEFTETCDRFLLFERPAPRQT